MNKKIFIVAALLLPVAGFVKAQNTSVYEKHLYVWGQDTLPYRLLLPLNYNAKKNYPLVLFLHGAGERGNDNEKQLSHGGDHFLIDSIRKNYPAIVVFPQCATNGFWSNIIVHNDTANKKRTFEFPVAMPPKTDLKLVMLLVAYLEKNYKIDTKRMYVGGLSLGGMGTYELLRNMPGKFAAAFAICGGADPVIAKQITKPSWWIFHGLKDDVVDPELSKNMAAALKDAGADVRITLYPEDGHNSWDDAFKEPQFFSWMFSHHQ
jgi:predicted peptidase